MTRFPVNFSESPATLRSLPPQLGENSVEILQEAGFSQAEIDAMLESGATLQPRDA
jgi:crotonobetainyl-CoA:carnitine CoA-transferase CaiB-like acyl-CoA transferase